jgi:hypothetical protein
MKRLVTLTAAVIGGIAIAAGCGGGDDDDQGATGKGGSSGASGAGTSGFGNGSFFGSGGNSGGAGMGGRTGASDSCTPQPDDQNCVGEQYAGETIPVDVYIMFDQSCSMSCPISRSGPGQCCRGGPDPRITPVREAVAQFLKDPKSAGMGVGIGYFGYMPAGETTCDADDYDAAAVGIGQLPAHANAILESLNAVEPTGETPTGAAIRGACEYTNTWKQQNPAHSTVILLVTDGIPETPASQCGANIDDAVEAAKECLEGSVPIKTFVLGVGQALENLSRIADAGGTNDAYLVSGGDVSASVVAALNAIRAQVVIPCELKLPPAPSGQQLDRSAVNLGICDASGKNQLTYYVESKGACGADGGWYYDDPNNPQRIMLCEPSCDTVSVPGAQLFYTVGCKTQSEIR